MVATKIDCASCGGTAHLWDRKEIIKYHHMSYTVDHYYYKCDLCGEEYTTAESDTETLKQIPAYAKQHNL